MNITKFLTTLFILSLFIFISTAFFKDSFPKFDDIQENLSKEPLQIETTRDKFNVEKKGVNYTIEPLYEYELWGLVVSEHDARKAFDYYHDKWKDYLNVKDLCVIWGDNLEDENYKKLKYKNGSFTCFVKTDKTDVWQAFHTDSLSNNHLITADPALVKEIRKARKGDQIYFKGYLAKYSNDKGFNRGTSTTRTDMGGNAYETVFVEKFETLSRSNPVFDVIHEIFKFLSLILFVALVISFLFPKKKPYVRETEEVEPRGYRGWKPDKTS